MDIIRWALFGNIYTETYEHFSDGGPKCYEDMTNTFRITISAISAIFCFVIMSKKIFFKIEKCWNKISTSHELTKAYGKKPNYFEIIIGLMCWGTFAV